MRNTLPFNQLVEVNPGAVLRKGTEYPFVEMGAVDPGRRYVSATRRRVFKSGGARFRAGDTLFARITPSLENGKIAQFNGDAADSVGFGSTEFFVFRARPELSDPAFVCYLARSDILRGPAEKSLTGTSGRQRADLKSFVDLPVPAPRLPTQRKIAAILSAYDDLIENSFRRIEILEEMARNLYREWFVEFRFPGHERARFVDSSVGRIPEGWAVGPLGEVCEITMGQSPKSMFYNEHGEGLPFHQGVSNFGARFPTTRVFSAMGSRRAEAGDVLFSVRAPVGRLNVAPEPLILGRGLCGIRHRQGLQRVLLRRLQYDFRSEDSIGGGTIFKAVTKSDMKNLPTLVASTAVECSFDEEVGAIDDLIEGLTKRNESLRQTRDLLLSKLISGDIDVSALPVRLAPPAGDGAPGGDRATGVDDVTRYEFFRAIAGLPFVDKVVLFGSRARNDHEERSDIDLAVFCDGASDDEWQDVLDCLREDRIDTLLKVDCVRFDRCDAVLREHVLTEGVVLYEKDDAA